MVLFILLLSLSVSEYTYISRCGLVIPVKVGKEIESGLVCEVPYIDSTSTTVQQGLHLYTVVLKVR